MDKEYKQLAELVEEYKQLQDHLFNLRNLWFPIRLSNSRDCCGTGSFANEAYRDLTFINLLDQRIEATSAQMFLVADKIKAIKKTMPTEINHRNNYPLTKILYDWQHKIERRHMNDLNAYPTADLDKLKSYLADYEKRALLSADDIVRLKRDIESADKWIAQQE